MTGPTFGAGGAEPYDRTLRLAEAHELALRTEHGTPVDLGAERWYDAATDADLTLLRAVSGPLLDVGCGPGRMVLAATELGLDALGIDVAAAAVERALAAGAPALEASVFDPLPREGEWQTVLLVDGNVGIGGDPSALLARCAELLRPDGEVVVELHRDARRDHRFEARVIDGEGRESDPFPWAELGVQALPRVARSAELRIAQLWEIDARCFARLAAR